MSKSESPNQWKWNGSCFVQDPIDFTQPPKSHSVPNVVILSSRWFYNYLYHKEEIVIPIN